MPVLTPISPALTQGANILVGDVIVGARTLFPDPCSTVAAPLTPTVTATAPGSLPSLSWTIQTTAVNRWGESLPSPAFVTAATQEFSVSCGVLPPGAVSFNVYFFSAGVTPVYVIPLPAGTTTVNVISLTNVANGTVPLVGTAYLPDTDGGMITAFQMYKWLNQALNIGAQRNGGFLDVGGVAAANTQPTYTLDGHWKQIDHAFFEGWPLYLGTRDDIFRHSLVPGITGYLVAQRVADQIVIELYPQPDQAGSTTALAGPMLATDTQLTVSSGGLGNFLPFGVLQVTNGTNYETMLYGGISGNVATGLSRGMCGTIPQAWGIGATVNELNIRIEGRRYPETYVVGNSLATLRLPPGWDGLLEMFLLHKFKTAEQQWPEAKDILAAFIQSMDQLVSSSQPVESPTQLRGGTTDEAMGIETVGRLIIP